MKNFTLLFKDELYGFSRSGVMIALFIIIPILSLPLYFLMRLVFMQQTGAATGVGPQPIDFSQFPIIALVTNSISNIAAQITALVLVVNIINEKQKNVYDIFVIRPIPRAHILLSKFFAVLVCVSLACLLAIGVCVVMETLYGVPFRDYLLWNALESFVLSLGIIGSLSAVGILFGIMTDSIVVGVILILFLGGNVTLLPSIPMFMGVANHALWSFLVGALVTGGILWLSISIFNKKQF